MYFTRESQKVLFYHLKGFRELENDNSNLSFLKTKKAKKIKDLTYNPKLIRWEDAQKNYPVLKDVPNPNKIISIDEKDYTSI